MDHCLTPLWSMDGFSVAPELHHEAFQLASKAFWLALKWDHHIPHSYGQRQASNLQHSKDSLLTRQKLNHLCHWAVFFVKH